MKKEVKISGIIRTILYPLSIIAGFFTYGCKDVVCYYMAPVITRIQGTVMDSSTSNAIQGIRVGLLDESTNFLKGTYSDSNGNFSLSVYGLTNDQKLLLTLNDVDGASNGGTYLSQTNELKIQAESTTNVEYYLNK